LHHSKARQRKHSGIWLADCPRLAQWISESLKTIPEEESFRLIIAWSLSVRKGQGHIFKIWDYKNHFREIAECATYQDYVKRFRSDFVPLRNWEKDVFVKEINGS
jgi:hypothetical protein